jgi:carbonic anhydrase
MCQSPFSRRKLLAAGATLCAGAVTSRVNADPGVGSGSQDAFPVEAAAALERLMAGNARFLQGRSRHPHEENGWRRGLEQTQRPFATVFSCSDSRVPPELLFDQGFGDLFVIRVAGQVMSTSTLGSLEYALVHLKTPLFLVLGHEHCGAVTAAVQSLKGEHKEPRKIQDLVDLIEPGLHDLDLDGDSESVIAKAVEMNVQWGIKQLREIMPQDEPNASLTVVGAVYDLDRGAVRVLKS